MTEQSKSRGVVYPRFLGMDDNGDFVWELADGRWTWGSDPYDAACRKRTFTPDRYEEKYGEPTGLADLPTRLRELRPESVTPAAPEPAERYTDFLADLMTARQNGSKNALAAMERAVKGWAQGAADSEEAVGRPDRKPSDEQPFVLADILRMIDDAAREVGVAPVYSDLSEGSKS